MQQNIADTAENKALKTQEIAANTVAILTFGAGTYCVNEGVQNAMGKTNASTAQPAHETSSVAEFINYGTGLASSAAVGLAAAIGVYSVMNRFIYKNRNKAPEIY